MIFGLLIVLALILVLPFAFRYVEHNLEYFLFIMGFLTTIISGVLSWDLISHILENYLLYLITAAVLIAGMIFRLSVNRIKIIVGKLIERIPLKIFIFVLIILLGLISSLITAIIASLILVEIIHVLPFKRRNKVLLTVITCFSIGLGAALTPIGEPLSTIVVSSLKADFLYLFREIGVFIIPCILALGVFGALYVEHRHKKDSIVNEEVDQKMYQEEDRNIIEMEAIQAVFMRAIKIFVFIIALELLGAGFKPLINNYIIHLDSRILYWINMSSAVLDNATIAAAEVSPAMSTKQIQAILMGLLLSGGMLIPGNIPNIISAGKLNIKSREWAIYGLPIGLTLLVVYFVIIFILL